MRMDFRILDVMSLADLMDDDTKRTRPNGNPPQKPTQDRKKSKTQKSDRKNAKSAICISKEKRFQNFSKEERYILYEGLIKLAQMRRKLWQNSRSKDVRDKVLTLLNLSSEMEKM